jgi:hypothetical protein
MVRHIKRLHGSQGEPVKEKPSTIDSSIQNMFVNSSVPPLTSGEGRPIARQRKDNDIVDMFFDKIGRIEKVEKVKAFFSRQGTSTMFPSPANLHVPTNDSQSAFMPTFVPIV